MHPNPAFRQESDARALAFARARGFGVLTLAGAGAGTGPNGAGPLASHIPFVLVETEEGLVAEAHLVRSNPIWAAIATPQPALLIVSGPDAYVSPDWYGVADQVPTWNYVAVHLSGQLARRDLATLGPHADRLSAEMEGRLAPKPPWTSDKMTPEALARLRRMIVPVALTVSGVESTWKLNQNKPAEAIAAAADGIEAAGIGQETKALAALMRRL